MGLYDAILSRNNNLRGGGVRQPIENAARPNAHRIEVRTRASLEEAFRAAPTTLLDNLSLRKPRNRFRWIRAAPSRAFGSITLGKCPGVRHDGRRFCLVRRLTHSARLSTISFRLDLLIPLIWSLSAELPQPVFYFC